MPHKDLVQWILVVPAAFTGWFIALFIGLSLYSVADNFCPPELMISGMCTYLVDAGTLYIRSGPFSWSISLGEIKSVKPNHSLLSSPALSLHRLEIQYGRGKKILVSPKDIGGFRSAIGRD